MKSSLIRKKYLDFFESKKHKIIESDSILVKNDPTLMFTNAGMNQFKDIFLSQRTSDFLRIANYQKCLRVSGKHNDLEEVGHDSYHHTMFEMLGSWSFNDYFKEDAINWAWEFLTEVCSLDKKRIYVTVFEGDKKDNTGFDKDSFEIWKKILPEKQILKGSKKDNFWEMGITGPCGPCTEIHYDNRPNNDRENISGKSLVNQDHPAVIEIWNLVFIQYNRTSDLKLIPLDSQFVDTGMGFERLCMIMQNKQSTYETDLFHSLISNLCQQINYNYGKNAQKDIAVRVIVDHIRAIVFSIADGQLPSNNKSGYVIRRILRRAVRYAYTFLDIKKPFLFSLVPTLANQLGDYYQELIREQDMIVNVIQNEEESFLKTLEAGLKRIEDLINNNKNDISGKHTFELYDTYGFPIDLTQLILKEKGLEFDINEFEREMNKQKERSKKAAEKDVGDWIIVHKDSPIVFSDYNTLEKKVKILKYRKVKEKNEVIYHYILDSTPFYPEGGGQKGDIGVIENELDSLNIINTIKENDVILHCSNQIPNDLKKNFMAKLDKANRLLCSKNHTATHLLQESLKNVLGNHVEQKGSLVDNKHLRFDFSHYAALSKKEIILIEKEVNKKVMQNIALQVHLNIPFEKAKKMGAMMLFGEKYGDKVRVIQFDSSKELCGGTHVKTTGEIGLFKIYSESSISSGIRRIQAYTGENALNFINERLNILENISLVTKNKNPFEAVEKLIFENKKNNKEVKDLKREKNNNLIRDLKNKEVSINNIRFISAKTSLTADDIKQIMFSFRKEKDLIVALTAIHQNKATISILFSENLIKEGFNANEFIKEACKDINGSGGGQNFFASATGSKISGIDDALKRIKMLLNKKTS